MTRPQVFYRSEIQPLDFETERLEASRDDLQASLVFGTDRGSADQLFSQIECGAARGRSGHSEVRARVDGAIRSNRRGLITKRRVRGKPVCEALHYVHIAAPKGAGPPHTDACGPVTQLSRN